MNEATLQAFVDDILAAPSDPAPRLILADWLEEKNNGQASSLRLYGHWCVDPSGCLFWQPVFADAPRLRIDQLSEAQCPRCAYCGCLAIVYWSVRFRRHEGMTRQWLCNNCYHRGLTEDWIPLKHGGQTTVQ